MTLSDFLSAIRTSAEQISFPETIAIIDASYDFTPAAFTNGEAENEAGTNNGSCKILAFGQMHGLTKLQTLHLFGDYYRKDVCEHPSANDHGNIRNFREFGWDGVTFDSRPLALKA